jgi:hypothetical protein
MADSVETELALTGQILPIEKFCRMSAAYSKPSLVVPAETIGHFFPIFTKSVCAIIFQNHSIIQMIKANLWLLVS